jgi:hypothetical protein
MQPSVDSSIDCVRTLRIHLPLNDRIHQWDQALNTWAFQGMLHIQTITDRQTDGWLTEGTTVRILSHVLSLLALP